MRKMLKIIGIIIIIVVVVGIIAFTLISKYLNTALVRMMPENILESAPNTVNPNIEINLSNPLQKSITGGVIEGYDKDGVQIYLGVPFAAPPVKDLRWKAPQDVINWDGVRETKKYAPNPIQAANTIKPNEYGAETVPNPEAGYSEDCLYLNIWTTGKKGDNMPVVFYIPGGAWISGSNTVENYNGEYLAKEGVIFVGVNYRLGMFGFLGADVLKEEDSKGSTGNYGLMDLIKALEWVKDNIDEFGGNPDNVTLYGGSAGGNLIDNLMVSPEAVGLFKRAVSMSYLIDMISPAWDYNFKTSWGNKVIKNKETLDKLREMDTLEVVSQKNMLGVHSFSGPTIDGVYLPYTFREGIEKGMSKDVDYIVGVNYSEEFTVVGEKNSDDAKFIELMGGKPENVDNESVLMTVLNSVAIARSKGGATNTYVLEFEHPTPGEENLGAVHGGDLQYMIHYFSDNRKKYWSDSDYKVGDIASSYFINFVKTGNPNGTTKDGNTLPVWKQSFGDYNYLGLNETPQMKSLKEQNINKVIEYFEEKQKYNFLRK